MKSLLLIVPLIFLVFLQLVAATGKPALKRKCEHDMGKEKLQTCVMNLITLGLGYQNWNASNFDVTDKSIVLGLKSICGDVKKCLSTIPTECLNEKSSDEVLTLWCGRIEFYSSDFQECVGKLSKMSNSGECDKAYFNVMFTEKDKSVQCEILSTENKKCIAEKVKETCSNKMAENLEKFQTLEEKIIGC